MAAPAIGGGKGSILPEPTPQNSGGKLVLNEELLSQIDQAALDSYAEHGYIVGPVVLDPPSITALRASFERVFCGERDFRTSPYEFQRWQDAVSRPADSISLKKVNNSWWINETIRSVVLSPVLGEMAARLMGTSEVRLWHDQAIWKPGQADRGANASLDGNVGWHQDYAHWQVSNTVNMCTAFIALQDTDLSNGGLRTIEGSHKWGLLQNANSFFETDLDKLADEHKTKRQKTSGGESSWTDKPTILKAGQVAFHHSLTVHGSGANLTAAPRMALAVHLQPADCGLKEGNKWHQNLKDLGPNAVPGDLFAGPTFPVLWPTQDDK